MSYIRTLLGKLGFEVDSKPLEQFNEEIAGTSEKMEDAGDASEGLLGRMAKLNQAWELAAKLGGAVLGTLKDLAFSPASHAAGVADAAAQIGVEHGQPAGTSCVLQPHVHEQRLAEDAGGLGQ